MDIMRKNRNYWNKENCMIEALKHTTRSEFKFNAPSAYISARKNGFLEEICSHMIKLGNKCNRCIYAYEFSDNHAYVGLTCNIEKRLIWRKNNMNDAVTKHIKETGILPKFIQLTDYMDINDASKMEGTFFEKYRNNNWILLNVAKTGSIGGNCLIWDFDKCRTEAHKYDSRINFRINSGSAYNSAQRNMWLDEICSHMKKYERKIIWTYDKCQTEALKYSTKKEFKERCSVGYSIAVKNKWIDSISEHMHKLPYNTIYWTYDRCLLVVKDCKTRTEFAKKYGGAYYRARENKWLNSLFD